MSDNKQSAVRDPYTARRMKTYFKFSMIGIAVVVLAILVLYFTRDDSESIDYSKSDFVQLEEPADDTPVVVFETTEGEFRAVLYEDEAPEYCEYFIGLVNDGYFDDTQVCTILRSSEGVTGGFIAGSRTADGTADDDTDMTMTDIEVSANMLPIKGAIGSLVKQGGTFSNSKAGSVFTVMYDVVDIEELRSSDTEDVNGYQRVSEIFQKYGGVPNYLQMYTLFAQVYDGWDTIDAINAHEIQGEETDDDDDDKNYQPKEEIKFTKVYMSTYGEKKENGYNIPIKDGYEDVSDSDSDTASQAAGTADSE